jgi:plasmid stabilization system protein ParE
MATVRYTEAAIADIRRLALFLFESDPAAARATTELIEDGLGILERHPLVGRPTDEGLRELPISRGDSGYLALYAYDEREDAVIVLAIRHQREAGFQE